jgi:CheY-like chemotaxis protein
LPYCRSGFATAFLFYSGFPTKRILIRKPLISGDNLPATEQYSAGSEESAGMSSSGTGTAMGRVLLVCDDSAAIQQLAEGMQQFAIATEVCVEVSMALRLLNRKKFEAIIIDFGMAQADEMLQQIRLSPSNRTAVTFAVTDPAKPTRFETQPNFVMEKPLSPNTVGRTFKAAFGLIVRERRRSFRCPVEIAAIIQTNGTKVDCHLVNVSEGGMAIAESPLLKPGTQVNVSFTLPGELLRFKIESEVCWCDEKGRAGLRSLMIPSEQKSILQGWLAAKLEEDLPESVARRFQKE